MSKLTRRDREAVGRKRILNILKSLGVANPRTLEQKISDAGPNPVRVDPHILTPVRNALVMEGVVSKVARAGTSWFYTTDCDVALREARLSELSTIYNELNHHDVRKRIGQTLEIATYRAICDAGHTSFGRYRDINDHDDSMLYSKDEPPSHISNRSIGAKSLDFMVSHQNAGIIGIECKNIREWLYPDRNEVKDALYKCLTLDCIPVIIGRRIPYVTSRLLKPCGVIIHQTFNQLLPRSEQAIADKAKHKHLLGYHDIRTGNIPDARLATFIGTNMMAVAEEARQKFDAHKDLIEGFIDGSLPYHEFAARIRRRENGLNEDYDWDENDPADWW